MLPDHQTISPLKFEAAAKKNYFIWQLLNHCHLVHKVFGPGRVTAIHNDKKLTFTVRFEQPYQGIHERQFAPKGFGGYFSQLILPNAKYEKVQALLNSEPAPKQLTAPSRPPQPQTQKSSTNPRPPMSSPRPVGDPAKKAKQGAPKPKPRKAAPVTEVKCPYCIRFERSDELESHIRMYHRKKYPAWLQASQRVTRSDSVEKTNKVKSNEAKPENPVVVLCPICERIIKRASFSRHLQDTHPGIKVSDNPPIALNIPHIPMQKYEDLPDKPYKPLWRVPSGKIQQTSMSVINVNRKSRGYVRRK